MAWISFVRSAQIWNSGAMKCAETEKRRMAGIGSSEDVYEMDMHGVSKKCNGKAEI